MNTNQESVTILLVDDEQELRDIFASELRESSFTVHTADGVDSALAILQNQNVDVVVSDLYMPGGTGLDLIAKLKNMGHKAPFLLVSGDDAIVPEAKQKGVKDVLVKPFEPEDLIQKIKSVLN